ncbi:hypothetical protein MJM99_32230, partial [Salmonella enterica subsp. enterica serovar Kentucky]|nr:hypothetical protein [Salmonella enterica subsp. enterica serovar Kentucky]
MSKTLLQIHFNFSGPFGEEMTQQLVGWLPFISAGLRYLLVNGANLPRSLASRARFMRDLLPKPHYAAG